MHWDHECRSVLSRGLLWVRGIELITPENRADGRQANSSELGTVRWIAERTVSWLREQRRLRVLHVHRADIHEAFLTLGCTRIGH